MGAHRSDWHFVKKPGDPLNPVASGADTVSSEERDETATDRRAGTVTSRGP